jgi:hypothetical protein
VLALAQVHRLQNKGKLVTLTLPSGPDDTALLRAEDYIAEVKKYERVFREQLRQRPGDDTISSKLNALAAFGRALPHLTSLPTAPLKVLMSKMSECRGSADEQHLRAMVGYVGELVALCFELREQKLRRCVWLYVRHIQRLGFLLPTTRLDDEAYSFSVPGVGKVVSAIKKTRTLILSTLKRTKYKEMLEQQLKKLKLKHSRFQLEFHLADMEGCGLIRRTKATSGVLVVLADQ